MNRIIACCCCGVVLSACNGYPLVDPNGTIAISESVNYTYEEALTIAGTAAAVYWYVDPLAPNWEVNEFELDNDKYRITLRKKLVTRGGDGEAVELFNRHAERIADTHGYERFVVLAYSERVESNTIGTQRVAKGLIKLTKDLESPPPEPLNRRRL